MKIKVLINGETHEVEQSAIDAGNLLLVDPDNPPKGLFNQSGVNEVVSAAKQGLKNPNTLIDDLDFQKQVLSKFDIALDDDGKPKGLKAGDDDEAKFRAWSEKHLNPLKSELEQKDSVIQKQNKNLVNATVDGLTARYLKDSASNNTFIKKGVSDSFKFDPEVGRVVPLDETGSPARHGNGNVMTPEEWFQNETKTGSLKDVAKDNRPGSSGFQGGSTAGETISIKESDAKNAVKYEKAQKIADEEGKSLEIIKD